MCNLKIMKRQTYYLGKEDIHRNAKLTPTDKRLQWEMMLGKRF